MSNGCPQPGSGGVHSVRYYDEDGVCSCAERNDNPRAMMLRLPGRPVEEEP